LSKKRLQYRCKNLTKTFIDLYKSDPE
jgi:hypothetical protein